MANSSEDDVVARVREIQEDFVRAEKTVILAATVAQEHASDLRTLLARLDAAERERDVARDFRLRVLDAVGPCAPEEDGVASLPDVIRRIQAERDAARGALRADAERLSAAEVKVFGESVHGCDAADWMADEVIGLRAELATLRETLVGEVRGKVGDLCSFKDDPNHDGGEPLCNYCVEGNTLLRVFAILDSMKNAELDSTSPDRILPAPVQEEHGDTITPTPNGPPTEA